MAALAISYKADAPGYFGLTYNGRCLAALYRNLQFRKQRGFSWVSKNRCGLRALQCGGRERSV
jgi:hypothetical protein